MSMTMTGWKGGLTKTVTAALLFVGVIAYDRICPAPPVPCGCPATEEKKYDTIDDVIQDLRRQCSAEETKEWIRTGKVPPHCNTPFSN
jgi:hypothetical protein